MAYDYAREKFYQAVDVLLGDGNIQKRLADAAIVLTRLEASKDLPEKLSEEFEAVYYEPTKEAATGDEGTLLATTRKLSSEAGVNLAQRIFLLYRRLHGDH